MIGQTLSGRYQIIQNLSRGGMGQTYVAEDTQRPGNPKCVVKQLQLANNDPNFLPTARRLFDREAQMLEQLGDHSQIPRLLAHFEQDEEFYLVQEFIEGHPLSDEIAPGKRWSEERVMQLLEDVLTILKFVHERGIIHRDIKPENLIRRADGKLVLIDFGIVAQSGMRSPTVAPSMPVQTVPGYSPTTPVYTPTEVVNAQPLKSQPATVAIGTLGYMPPEQMSSKPHFSSDLYALGMTAIQALTGIQPAELEKDEDGEVIWRNLAVVSEGLAAFLTKIVRHYFKFRYQSASEALQALQAIANPSKAKKASNKSASFAKGEIIVLAIGLIGSLGGFGYWYYSQRNIFLIEKWGFKLGDCNDSVALIELDKTEYCVKPTEALPEGKYIYSQEKNQLERIDIDGAF
jgi:serine/threonine protein kinase